MNVKRFQICALALAVAMTAFSVAGCGHEHTPGPAATCTDPQVCTECGDVLTPAKGHTPGVAATCVDDQVCTVCGAVIAPAKGHTPGKAATCTEPQVCTVCGEILTPALGHKPESRPEGQVCTVCGQLVAGPNQQYTPGGGESVPVTVTIVPESTASGHYNADVAAYYTGGVVVAGDYGYEPAHPINSTGSDNYASAVNDFAAKYPNINVSCAIIPKSSTFNSVDGFKTSFDAVSGYINGTYAKMDGRIKTADVLGVMNQHKGEYMFYRTDHHWTGLGAYYASVAYCNANGITPYALDTYDTVIKTGFIGTLYSFTSSDANLKRNPDYTVGHYPHTGYAMSYCDGGKWYKGVAINAGSNSYAGMYINGDKPLTVIDTDNKNGRALLIFKESYGNAFVPYMIDYYERVVVVDIRKTTDPVSAIIQNYGITDALIINNIQASGTGSLVSQLRTKAMS